MKPKECLLKACADLDCHIKLIFHITIIKLSFKLLNIFFSKTSLEQLINHHIQAMESGRENKIKNSELKKNLINYPLA